MTNPCRARGLSSVGPCAVLQDCAGPRAVCSGLITAVRALALPF